MSQDEARRIVANTASCRACFDGYVGALPMRSGKPTAAPGNFNEVFFVFDPH